MKSDRRNFVINCLSLLGLSSVMVNTAQAKTITKKNCRNCKSFRSDSEIIDDDCGKCDLIDKEVSSRGWCEDFNKK